MGCGASKPATDEEKQEICKVCAKDMMNLCIDDALTSPDQIKVKAPSSLDTVRSSSATLRETAAKLLEKSEAEGESQEEEGGGGGGGGLMGAAMGLFSKAKEVASEAMKLGTDITFKGASMALTKSADLLDTAIAQVEEPMTNMGNDIVQAKKTEITAALKEHVQTSDVPNAAGLCMGDQTDAVSKCIIGGASDKVSDLLKVAAGEKLKEHKAIKAWDSLIETYNKMCNEVNKIDLGEDFKISVSPIESDIDKHICTECAMEVGRLTGEAEAKHREAPANKGQFPDIFEKVFKKAKEEKDQLTLKDYKAVTQPKK